MKKTILIADDDPDILFTLRVMLEAAGYEVLDFSEGRFVLEGKYEYPDLFILDKRMPDIDGLDVCRQLRTRPECNDIPIIIISASPKFGPPSLAAGANDFLEKPFQLKDLLAMVKKYTTKGES